MHVINAIERAFAKRVLHQYEDALRAWDVNRMKMRPDRMPMPDLYLMLKALADETQ